MNLRTQLYCLWCGPIAIVLFFIGFWAVAGLIPPPTPHDSAQEIQNLYQDNTDGIRIGLLMTMVAGGFTAPWVAAISTQMKRVEGEYAPLTYTQLGTGMLGVLLFIFPVMAMETAAFRPDRDPNLILLLNDLGWIPFVGIFMLAVTQNIAIGICALKDEAGKVFPRWLGYFNIWVALLFVPAALLYFFKTGAFAWSGLFVFWVPASAFGLWFIVVFIVLRKSILRQIAEEGA